VDLLDRATRRVFESGRPIAHVAADPGLPSEPLHTYIREVEANEGLRPNLPTSAERRRLLQRTPSKSPESGHLDDSCRCASHLSSAVTAFRRSD
jgi:hypothetical protein